MSNTNVVLGKTFPSVVKIGRQNGGFWGRGDLTFTCW